MVHIDQVQTYCHRNKAEIYSIFSIPSFFILKTICIFLFLFSSDWKVWAEQLLPLRWQSTSDHNNDGDDLSNNILMIRVIIVTIMVIIMMITVIIMMIMMIMVIIMMIITINEVIRVIIVTVLGIFMTIIFVIIAIITLIIMMIIVTIIIMIISVLNHKLVQKPDGQNGGTRVSLRWVFNFDWIR